MLAALLLGGPVACVSETVQTAPERDRHAPAKPSRPAGVVPEQMTLSAGAPSDSDGNLFPDMIPVVVFLFGDTRRYELPITAKGTFEFFLAGPDGAELGHWVFAPDDAARAVGETMAGKCYRFALRMAPDRDRMSSRPASLRAIFTNSETNERVFSPGTTTIRVGAGE